MGHRYNCNGNNINIPVSAETEKEGATVSVIITVDAAHVLTVEDNGVESSVITLDETDASTSFAASETTSEIDTYVVEAGGTVVT